MKKAIRILSMILAASMIFAALVSCDVPENNTGTDSGTTNQTEKDTSKESDVSSETETESKSETEVVLEPPRPENQYGTDFFLSVQPDSNKFEYHWVEESQNDAMSQAVFDRQQKVYQHLGVEVIATATETSKNYVEPFKNSVKNKDGSVDALMTHHYHGIDGFISGNYLADFNSYTQIDLSADYWNADVMEEVALNGRMYLGKSDFNILSTYVIAYNKEMLDRYCDSLPETVYQMVDNYRWTLDQMISIANMVYIDTTSDGHTIDDTFGVVAIHDAPFCGFLLASNISMIEQNETGAYTLSVYNDINKEKTTIIVEKLRELAKSNSAWFWKWGSTETVEFCDGKALLSLSNTSNLPSYLNYDISFGVLPYPMYEEAQKDIGYRSLQFGGFTCIPSYVTKPEMVGDTLEMLSFFSKDVNTAFYEKLLGKQASDSPDDTRMLNIVWDGIGTDFAQTFYSAFIETEIFHMMIHLTYKDATQNVASYIASKESNVNKRIDKFMKSLAKIQ